MGVSGATTSERIAMLDASLDKTGLYLGLLTTMPTLNDGSDYVEVVAAGSNYARLALNPSYTPPSSNSEWESAATSGNGVAVSKKGPKIGVTWTFNQNTGTVNWGHILGWAIFDSATRGAGTMKHCGLLNSPIDVVVNQAALLVDANHQIICQLGDSDDTF